MNPIELADRELGQYKKVRGEINARDCPFCGPNQKSDNQYKFYMNAENGAFKCYREKHCGRTGSFYELLEHFGLEDEFEFEDDDIDYQQNYTKPEVKTNDPSGPVEEYLDLRCIDKEIWQKHNVKEKDGNIAFEYYQDGELVLVKYRTASKDKRYWQEGGGKPVLWEIDKVNPEKPLVICEGELDKLAIHQAGYENVVSVPFGTNNLKWINHCWDTLEEVEEFVIWGDNDEAGEKMEKELVQRLGQHRCRVVECDLNDPNLVLFKRGDEAILNEIEKAVFPPIKRALQVKDIERFDPSNLDKTESNFPAVNKYLGGYMESMVSIWSGVNGSGKTTILGQEMLQAADQGKGACIVSGELATWNVVTWLQKQAVGPKKVVREYDERFDRENYRVPENLKDKFENWAEDRLFIYDSFESLKPGDILEVFRGLAKRYGTQQFLVDNLMKINYGSIDNKYSKQAEFVSDLKDFAMNYNAHVHIVAHPRKPSGIISKEDIAGLYEITNFADNVIAMHRIKPKNEKNFSEEEKKADNILEIFKCRLYGNDDISIRLNFNEPSKRFFQYGHNEGRNKTYGLEG